MRIARKTVPRIKQVNSAASALVLPFGGLSKFGSTPGGGGRAGPLRTSSSWLGGIEEKSRFDIVHVISVPSPTAAHSQEGTERRGIRGKACAARARRVGDFNTAHLFGTAKRRQQELDIYSSGHRYTQR